MPYIITQPDGEKISCFVTGDEYVNWIHDSKGYTLIKNPQDGYYYYAVLSGDKLVPISAKAGISDPGALGIEPGLTVSSQVCRQKKVEKETYRSSHYTESKLTNIVIFIRFKGDSEFTKKRQDFVDLFNSTTMASLKSYFKEVSYNYLDISSSLYPTCNSDTNLYIEDSHQREYFYPYNETTNPIGYTNDSKSREQNLIADAIEKVKSQIATDLNVDINNDGYVDNVTILIRGNDAGWNSAIWAHQWWLDKEVSINGKRVGNYAYLPENQCWVGTLCHEMFHVIGAPDLYAYSVDWKDNPIGNWDIMGAVTSSHMCAYMKWKYSGKKWINNIPEIEKSGKYKLLPLIDSKNCCYKISSPYSSGEYFVIEFRKKTGLYENSIHGSGLVIYSVNPGMGGNTSGPPWELYAFRPDGSIWSDGDISKAHFNTELGRGAFNSGTNPRCFLSDGSDGGISIKNITNHNDDSLTFEVEIDKCIDKSKWSIVHFDSEEYDSKASFAIDGDPSTFWHTGWRSSTPAFPHEIQIDFSEPMNFRAIRYTPRQDIHNGRINDFAIFSSNSTLSWGDTLVKGNFTNSAIVQTVGFHAVSSRYLRFVGISEVNGEPFASIADLDFSQKAPLISKKDWKVVECNSFQPDEFEAELAFDDNGTTFWHTKYNPAPDNYPHYLTIDMGRNYNIEAFSYLPRQDKNTNGTIIKYTLQTSIDNKNWVTVSSGDFVKNTGEKKIDFTIKSARYFKFTGLSEYDNKSFAAVAEISIFGVPSPANPIVTYNKEKRIQPSLNGFTWDTINKKLIAQFNLYEEQPVAFYLFTSNGKIIYKHEIEKVKAGNHKMGFSIDDTAPGIYFVLTNVNKRRWCHKMLITR